MRKKVIIKWADGTTSVHSGNRVFTDFKDTVLVVTPLNLIRDEFMECWFGLQSIVSFTVREN